MGRKRNQGKARRAAKAKANEEAADKESGSSSNDPPAQNGSGQHQSRSVESWYDVPRSEGTACVHNAASIFVFIS